MPTLVIFAALSGCVIPPVTPQVSHLGPDLSVKATSPNESKVLLFNNSSRLMFGVDNTGRINVWLNGRGVASLDIGEYVQISVPRGRHTLELLHRDIIEFRTSHELNVAGDTAIVEIAASILSNEFRVNDVLPRENDLPAPFVPYKTK